MKRKLIIYVLILLLLSLFFRFIIEIGAENQIRDEQTQNSIQNSVQDELDIWLDKLAFCESSNNPLAINPKDSDGRPKFGLYQFDIETWKFYIKKYNLFSWQNWEDADFWNSIFSREHQDIVVREMFKNGVDFKKEFGCVRKIGLITKK